MRGVWERQVRRREAYPRCHCSRSSIIVFGGCGVVVVDGSIVVFIHDYRNVMEKCWGVNC